MSWSDPRHAEIAHLLSVRTGFAFPETFLAHAESAIVRAMARARERDPSTYLTTIATNPKMLQSLVSEVTIGETFFFRNPEQFDFIRSTAIPELLADKPVHADIRIWSAGCSSGEEIYSLAMLTEELGIRDRSRLLATDISGVAIEAARRGIFREWSFREEAQPWRDRCFTKVGRRWEIAPRFRSAVYFDVLALRRELDQRFSNIDVLLCRNVLMYLESDAIADVARMLTDALSPSGWLFTSPSDPMLSPDLDLEVVVTPGGIAYRRRCIRFAKRAPVYKTTAAIAAVAAPPRRVRSEISKPPSPPLEPEFYVTRAIALLDIGDSQEALQAARKAIYLDRSIAIAHFVFGRASRILGRRDAAKRALTRARNLVSTKPDHEFAKFGNGLKAGALAANIAAELQLLQQSEGATT